MDQPYFIFNNVSSADMGVFITKEAPLIKPARDMEKIVIPGRDGYLTQDFKTYASTIKSVECTILNLDHIDDIFLWLSGSGTVAFSNQLDRKFEANIINQIPFNKIMGPWHSFIVVFDCQPLSLSLNNYDITLSSSGSVYNGGTYKSKPILKVYGTGDVDLSINGNTIHLTNIVDYVTIDSDLMDCYKDTLLKNSDMSGDFPELVVGENTISWTGTVTSILITPNWRYL